MEVLSPCDVDRLYLSSFAVKTSMTLRQLTGSEYCVCILSYFVNTLINTPSALIVVVKLNLLS
jgi:hypothetical protein